MDSDKTKMSVQEIANAVWESREDFNSIMLLKIAQSLESISKNLSPRRRYSPPSGQTLRMRT